MSLLKRVVASIRSGPADPEPVGAEVNPALRRLNDGVPREVDVDPKSWRRWCEAIRNAKLQQLKLGQIADSLRELPTNLWDQPLSNFISSPLEYLEDVPSVGEKRVEFVIEAIRSLGVELLDLPLESAVTLKFVPGPLVTFRIGLSRPSKVAPFQRLRNSRSDCFVLWLTNSSMI